MGAGYLMIFVYMLWSVKFGLKIGANPWKATGLEWQIQSPPTTHNFEQIPVVTEEAYAYGQASQQHGKEAPVVR